MEFDTEAMVIRSKLERHHDGKFGFVIFRCAYGNDRDWTRFLEVLTACAHAGLREDGDEDLKDHLARVVIENEAELKSASKAEVRRRFVQWVESIGGGSSATKYQFCIFADEEVVQSVIRADQADEEGPAFVKVLDRYIDEEPYQRTPEELPDDELRAKLNAGDESANPVEGCRQADVGWTKVPAEDLVPRVYGLLMSGNWRCVYARPPKIADS